MRIPSLLSHRRATATTGTSGNNTVTLSIPKEITSYRQDGPSEVQSCSHSCGSQPVSHSNRSLTTPGPSPPAQHPGFLIDCFPLAAQSDQGINIHALAPSRRAILPVCHRVPHVFSECLDSALSQEKRAESGQKKCYKRNFQMLAETASNPATTRPEPSRRFSVAPMMDWTYSLFSMV